MRAVAQLIMHKYKNKNLTNCRHKDTSIGSKSTGTKFDIKFPVTMPVITILQQHPSNRQNKAERR